MTLKKASDDVDLEQHNGHSYTTSFVWPFNSIGPVRSSFTKREEGKNSIETLFEQQNSEIDIWFFFMLSTKRKFFNVKVVLGVVREVELV